MARKIGLGVLVALLIAVPALALRTDLSAAEVEAAYRTPHSRFAALRDGTRVHYWDRGKADGPVLVLLHGSFDCANTWELWAPRLERDFRLIVPDLPAHGLTGRTVADDYDMDAMVATVDELLTRLGIARAHIAGNSMGGNAAWRFALAHPERVERLVLVDSSGYPGLDRVTPRADGGLMRFLYRHGNPRFLLASGFRRAIEDDRLVTAARIERWTAFVRREGSRDAQLKRATQRDFSGQPYARIPEIAQPTLLLWGELDPLVPVEHARRFERDLPRSRLIVYPRIGHMPQLELPDRSAADARAFLLSQEGRNEPIERPRP